MRRGFFILFLFLTTIVLSQNIKQQKTDGWWDQGVPIMPDDPYVMGLINELGDSLREWNYVTTSSKAKVCREIGLAFYDRGLYDAADFYLTRSKNFRQEVIVEKTQPKLSESELKTIESDNNILDKLPKSFDKLSRSDLKNLISQVESELKKLLKERDSLISINAPKELIESKTNTIKTLRKERNFLGLKIVNKDLMDENSKVRKYLTWSLSGLGLLVLVVIVVIQRKTIKVKDSEIISQLIEINKKNSYLEYAARLIRHDMHSGINTYIPKGITTLEKRLTTEDVQKLKIESSLKMIKEGLKHTQKVYKSVYEFTNLVKQNVVLDKTIVDIKDLLSKYLSNTSYSNQVRIGNLTSLEVNETLFCNAIDNLIRNGLKYNDSENKEVKIYSEGDYLVVEDNGRGLSQKQFDKIVNNYTKEENKDIDDNTSGLGLNICLAILEEHRFKLTCEKIQTGTKMKINIK